MAAIGARAPESTHLQDTVAWLAQQACASERVHSDATDWVIPTLYFAARHLDRPDLAARAGQAARWGVEMQLTCGAARGGVAATGQALLAWLTAFADTGWGVFAGASRRASRFLFSTLDDEGLWRRGGPYCTRSAWALAEAARRLGAPELRAAAARHLRAVA